MRLRIRGIYTHYYIVSEKENQAPADIFSHGLIGKYISSGNASAASPLEIGKLM